MFEEGSARYYVATFGCRVNQADSAGVAAAFDRDGLRRSRQPEHADIVVLNTCTVTHRSDADVRKAVARIRREAPHARVMVTGCFAQRDPQAAARIPGVSEVIGNAHKSRLPVLARAPRTDAPLVVHTAMESHALSELPVEPVTTVLDRTRPFVKIQDGCNAHCTYCIIPEVRGPARGAHPKDVETAIRTLVGKGYFEIVLAGIHLGTYAYPIEGGHTETLEGLVRRVLTVADLGRLRVSCIEPMAFPMALAEIAGSDDRLAPHFHLPLQSGSDRILKRMVRPYRADDFQRLLDGIRRSVPSACLGTDVIVGFPGETDADFRATVDFIEASGIDYVHVFSYSDRSGTPSARLDGKVDPRLIKDRSTELNAVSRRLWEAHLGRQMGRTLPVVILEPDPRRPDILRALSSNFCTIDIRGAALDVGSSARIRIVERRGPRLVGTPA